MSPEQISGKEVDQRSDLFSVGVIAYEIISGMKPFTGSGLSDVLYDVVNRKERPLTEVSDAPEWCAEYVARLLAKSPADRFATASDAARELRYRLKENVLEGGDEPIPVQLSIRQERTPDETPTTPIRVEVVPERWGTFDRHIPRRLAVAVIGSTLLATGGVIFFLQSRVSDEKPQSSHSSAQLAEFEQTEAQLREATLLYEAGAFEESRRRFDDYLARYPQSTVAREGRQRAEEALEQSRRADAPRITEDRRTPRSKTGMSAARNERKDERPSFWKRVKSWFSWKKS
jgi:serine/threonine protein kinase